MRRRGARFGLALLAVAVAAGSATAGRVAFDPFPVGTKGLAVGGAFTSLADDMGALYYNPAGLFQVEQPAFTYELYSILKVQRLIDTKLQVKWEYFPLLAAAWPIEPKRLVVGAFVQTLFKSMVESYTVHGLGGAVSWRVLDDLAVGATFGLALATQQGNSATGFFWQLGALWRLTPEVKFGATYRAPVALSWDYLRGDGNVDQNLPWSFQAGLSCRVGETSILTFELEHQHFEGATYKTNGAAAAPAYEGGLFKTWHPHVGFQFLHEATGALVRFGFMTYASASSTALVAQPALCLGFGAWTSSSFKFDFALIDSLIIGIFTRTDRFERFLLSFEYYF